MKDWRKILVAPTVPVVETMRIIDGGAVQLALVVDQDLRLLGTITDGDIRRAILRGIALDSPCDTVMNRSPITVQETAGQEAVLALMGQHVVHDIPVIDHDGRVVGLRTIGDLLTPAPRPNWVVIMAGGLGSRLMPLTAERPKPLLNVGGRPILETIVRNFVAQGFNRFFLSVNHMADQIIDHFGDGGDFGCQIEYLRENESLGTAGSLSLLPEVPTAPLLVMNGDILTNVDFVKMLGFHEEQQAEATLAVRAYRYRVPFGVVEMAGHRFENVVEKPTHECFVNAGIYVLAPAALAGLPQGKRMDMTELFKVCRQRTENVTIYPIREYWMDIGQVDDYQRANDEFSKIFP